MLSIHEILDATHGTLLQGRADSLVLGVSTDTRTLREGCLYIPLRGSRFDGHEFLVEAARGSAGGILLARGEEHRLASLPGHLAVAAVGDTLRALGDLARRWRLRHRLAVIAITGSTGKTTTKDMLTAIAARSRHVVSTEGNRNNLVGAPLTLFRIGAGHDTAILEIGTSVPGEIARLTEIVSPDVGVVTNTGLAHLEGLGSLEAIRREKGDLYRGLRDDATAIVNLDDDGTRPWRDRWRGRLVTFGRDDSADVMARRIRPEPEGGTSFVMQTGNARRPVRLAFPGVHHVGNALAAAAAATAIGLDADAICTGLSAFRPATGRLTLLRLGNGAFVLDDTYNANPVSVWAALQTLQDLKGGGRSLVVFGDMLELGAQAAERHREAGAWIARTGADFLYLRGIHGQEVASGARQAGLPEQRTRLHDDPRELAHRLADIIAPGDWVLVKGSRRMGMEAVVQALVERFGRMDDPVIDPSPAGGRAA